MFCAVMKFLFEGVYDRDTMVFVNKTKTFNEIFETFHLMY